MMRSRTLALALLITAVMSCRTQPPQPPQAPQPLPDFPLEVYRPAVGTTIYQIDGDHSRADILVRHGGKLALFGHDHVVSATRFYGYIRLVANDFTRSQADVRLALNSLIVDDPAMREQFALDTELTPRDNEKTSANMHGKVLQTDFWPQVHLKVEMTGGTPDAPEARLTMRLHGEEQSFPITFKAAGMGTGQIQADGSFSLRQSDYGITPFSILGGGLQVLDQVDVTFQLQADQVDSATPNQLNP
jgi:polyisoprenoid-binding protein YceI